MMRTSSSVTSISLLLLLQSSISSAFYLPGVVPTSYRAGDEVPFTVNALQPAPDMGAASQDYANGNLKSTSQLKSLIGLDYYHERLHFCQPQGGPKAKTESLGSALLGDRIYSSPMKAHMLQNETCVKLCETEYPPQDAKFVNERIQEGFAVNWMVDGLPVAKLKIEDTTHDKFYSIGFPLGKTFDDYGQPLSPPALNNHFDVYLEYHVRNLNEYRVVGATIWPSSRSNIKHKNDENPDCSDLTSLKPIRLNGPGTNASPQLVAFTMNTYWVESNTSWATRWDHYLRVFDPRIHWFSLINSIVIVSFLCVMVAMILVRSVSRDISRYNAIDLDEDVQEDFGWKLIHGEVFRPPNHPMLLSIMVGTGSQLTAMSLVTLFFALLGFLSPSNRGSLATVMIVAWTLFGALAGYMSARAYASLNGDMWKRNVFGTAVLFPTVIFASVNLLNFFLLVSGSSGAVPFGSLLALVALWFLINVPLTLLGSFIGIKHGGWRNPVSVSPIPRQIPPKIWYLRTGPSAIIAGILPFGAAFLELFFVLNSIFSSKVYYAFGFLALTFLITALTTATVTILFCYFTLCAEEYRWHWRAFLTGGGSAFWVFTYGLFYWSTKLELPGLANKVLYLGYLSLITLLDFILFGFIGWFSCYMAVRRIYSQVRID